MAVESADTIIQKQLNASANQIANLLLGGAQNGANFPASSAAIIAALPGIDEDDGHWNLPWVDNLSDILLERPQDLSAEDIGIIRDKLVSFIQDAAQPEQVEFSAQLYLHAVLGDQYKPGANGTALEQMPLLAVKNQLSAMTQPFGAGNPAILDRTQPYTFMAAADGFNPADPKFVETLKSAILQIQNDIRHLEDFKPYTPKDDKDPLKDFLNVGLDRGGMIGEQTAKMLPAYIAYSAELKDDVNARAIQFDYLMTLLEALPEEQKAKIKAELETISDEPVGNQKPASPATSAVDTTAPEVIAARGVLERAAGVMGVPASALIDVSNPSVLEAAPSAHIHEGFKREMHSLLSENLATIYARPDANAPDSEIFRSWFDDQNNAYEFVTQTDGSDALMKVEQDGSLSAVPAGQEPAVLFEFHVRPDGSINKYLMGENGQLLDHYLDGSPVQTNAEKHNFDLMHMNRVTDRFLQKFEQKLWDDGREQAGLDALFSAKPTAGQLETQILAHRTLLRKQVNDYFTAQGKALKPEELDSLTVSLMFGKADKAAMQGVLQQNGVTDPAQAGAMADTALQIILMRNLYDATALGDLSSFRMGGALPDGLSGRPLGMTEVWRKDWSNSTDQNGNFQWQKSTEFRPHESDIYESFVLARKNKQNLNIAVFEGNEFAMDYINQQAAQNPAEWDLDYGITPLQGEMVTRAVMMKEALDRYNKNHPDAPVTDINSPEAKAQFLEDMRNGQYNWQDVELMMRSFDADQAEKQRSRAEFAAAEPWMAADHAKNPDFWFEADDKRRRSRQFNETFGQDYTLSIPGQTAVEINGSTLSVEQGMQALWSDSNFREKYGYADGKDRSHIGYDDMVGMLMAKDPSGNAAKNFANDLKNTMEKTSLYQLYQTPKYRKEYVESYKRAMDDRREEAMKTEIGVLAKPADSVVKKATLDSDMDTIIPAPPPPKDPNAEPEGIRFNRDYNENAADLTEPAITDAIQAGNRAPKAPATAP